ncbi:MAG TPA: DUF5995 family protein, partial [Acidimicrobiales bacterium]|nr:DUF5995 family protein [Acidimicrobiales bacterium]
TAGEFGDSAFITELDVVFANLYFAAVDAVARGGTVPVAWRPLAESRGDARIEPIQFALAGMNAHINHDLPMAVVETCEALGTKPDAGSHHSDYQEIDPLLDAAEQKIREAFEPAEIASADRHAAVLNLIADWGIKGARDVAWESAVALWEVRHIKPAYDTLAAALAEASALASRALLVVV